MQLSPKKWNKEFGHRIQMTFKQISSPKQEERRLTTEKKLYTAIGIRYKERFVLQKYLQNCEDIFT